MLKFLSVFTVLQILLQPGNGQAYINQPNADATNNPYRPYQTINNDLENHHHRHVKPCLSRRRFHNANEGSLNAEWIPTFKVTIKEPAVKNVISQSLKEEAKDKKHNNVLFGKPDEELFFDEKLNRPAPKSSTSDHPISKDDCCVKHVNQEVLRRSMPDSAEIIEKQINLSSFQEEETISPVDDAEISNECNERKNSNSNPRRSNSNNGNIFPVPNKKVNKTKDNSALENEGSYVTSSFDNTEDTNFNNNDEQVQRNGFEVTKMAESSVILMQNFRTCYACSSANDPSCWHPSRRTTVKYCRKGHDACVTKTFTSSYGLILTRDCGRTCDDVIFPGVTPNYKSCSVCHYDLCNNAYCVKSSLFITIIFLIAVVKYSL